MTVAASRGKSLPRRTEFTGCASAPCSSARSCRSARLSAVAPRWGCESRTTASAIEALERLAVDVVDGRALDLQGGCELSGRLREVPVEDGETLDLLDAREAPVDLVDFGLEHLVHPLVACQRDRVGGRAEARRQG